MAQPTGGPDKHAASEDAFDVVHADTLRFFPELVRDLGGDPEHLLLEVGSDPAVLRDGEPVGYRLIANLLEHAAVRLRCPDFGMRLASRQGGGVFGPVGDVMRHSETFGDGLRFVVNHGHAHSLAARVRMEPDAAPGAVFVGHDILIDWLPHRRQAIEQCLLLGHLNAVETTAGKARVREARFRSQPLSPPATYRRYFGCDVRFDQHADGIVFREEDLSCPLAQRDAASYARARSFIETHLPPAAPPVRTQVRAVLQQLIETSRCSKERVAAELHMHPRTLYRRLIAEDTSFEAIKDEVRRDMALGYLSASTFSLQRIAEKVGYSEHSVLTRSCSRWFSASPREVRRSLLDSQPAELQARPLPIVPRCRDEA